ncbi:MAG: rRNA pseudouridine synthase [Saprospiraceae bacterium]|nr:rRNA pseudouridine synthase [Saprospiraceae bacterium]MDW8485023.1 pseudouridine synthase [Saprospiraceae bacterium]
MEEKKRRPRIQRPLKDSLLKERIELDKPIERPSREKGENRSFGRGERYSKQASARDKRDFGKKPFRERGNGSQDKAALSTHGGLKRKASTRKSSSRETFHIERKPKPPLPTGVGMPLNKYLSHCGLASRRKSVEYIEKGLVTVNGEVKLEPYYRVQEGDVIHCEGKLMQIQERKVYVLLNKPKGLITTTSDERGRPTVLDLVDPAFPERIYPVGRLDRDTTGLLLLTNDGELAAKLTHPSSRVQKQYRVTLNRPLTKADFERIAQGVELDDGPLYVNWIRYSIDQPKKDVVELEITEGRNRVVRRLFEALGYEVRKLDRFCFAGLTKKGLRRGAFRELTQREIHMLKQYVGHPSVVANSAEIAVGESDG